MPTKTDPKNPGDVHEALRDEKFNPYNQHQLTEKERAATDAKMPPDPFNEDALTGGFKTNMEDIKQKAQDKGHQLANTLAGPGIPGQSRFTAQLRKNGPVGAIIAAALTLFGFATFLPAGMPLIALKENVTNARGAASRAQPVRYKSVLRYMIGNKGVETACAQNVAGPRCKIGTLSERSAQKYKDAGFKIEGKAVGGRWIVHSMTAPDGTVMRSGDSFIRKMSTDLKFSRIAMRAHNAANNVLVGGTFEKLLLKLGLNKAPLPNLPEDKNERTKTANKIFKLKEDGTADRDKVRASIQEKATKSLSGADTERLSSSETEIREGGKIRLAKGLAAIPGLACMAYNVSKLIVNTAKAEFLLGMASVALPFLKVPDMIKDNEVDASGTTVSHYAGQLTTASSAKGMERKTAMDAQGIKMIFGSNEQGRAEYTKQALQLDNDILNTADQIISAVDDNISKVPGADGSVKGMCRLVSSWQGQLIGTGACVLMTFISGTAGAVGGTAVPGAGNVAGALSGLTAAAGTCLTAVLFSEIIAQGVEWMTKEWLLPWAVQAAVANIPNANSVGPPVGEAIAIGAAVILNKTNRANGLVPASKGRLRAFNAATRESDEAARQFEIAEARDKPFDIYNRYSLLGSIMSGMHNTVYTAESRMNSGNFALQRLFSAFTLAPSALAAVGDSPSPITAADLTEDNCDTDVRLIGGQCDISGQLSYAMAPEALTMAVDPNIDWMEEHKQIDDAGNAVHDAEFISIGGVDYTYERYITFCAERENEIGITTEPIESEIYDWSLGKHCFDDNEAMTQFQAYYSLMTGKADADYTEGESNSGVAVNVMSYNILGTNAGNNNDNDGGIPWRDRLNNTLITVKQESPEIIGFQEVSGTGSTSQYDLLKEGLADTYSAFPSSYVAGANRPIFWKTSDYTMTDSGFYEMSRNTDARARFPWVKLQSTINSKELYVFNIHTSAGAAGETRYGSAQSPPRARRDQAKVLIDTIKKVVPPGTPVAITGDFNSTCEKTSNDDGVSADEIPCAMLREAGFESAGETAHQQGKAFNFQYSTSHGSVGRHLQRAGGVGRHIDHVFYSSEFGVTGWKNIISDTARQASDHSPIVAALRMSVSEQEVAAGECPAGTTLVDGITDGWERDGTKKQITLCTIPGTRAIDNSATPHWRDPRYKGTSAARIRQIAVNADSAAALLKLAQDAQADGHTLTATIGYRSLYEQCSIVIKRYRRPSVCPSWITPVSGNWTSNATYSNHMMGYSVDFHGGSISWMKRNGPRCGWIDDVYRSQGWDQPHFTNKGTTPASCGIATSDNTL